MRDGRTQTLISNQSTLQSQTDSENPLCILFFSLFLHCFAFAGDPVAGGFAQAVFRAINEMISTKQAQSIVLQGFAQSMSPT